MEVKNKAVSTLIGWSEMELSQFVYDCGLAYLQAYVPDCAPEIFSHIIKSSLFWNWWKLNWQARDRAFLESAEMLYQLSKEDCLAIYTNLHDPYTLAAEIYPNGQVLGESYATLMGDIQKEALLPV